MSRPVILAGAGCPNSDELLGLGIPVLSSWQAADMFDNTHRNYFGRPGIYGQRIANKILFFADQVMVIGNRMAIWNVGYEGIPAEKLVTKLEESPEWLAKCSAWREELPLLERAHDDANGFINSYRFTDALQAHFRPDEVIVTDMGTPLICAHQVLRLRPPQRLMTSGGLGEMGCALPAAIGASFARNRGEVLCLHADGGMMMNLQELQTIVHHKLPIKIIVYENDGYGMIKATQDKAGMPRTGVSKENGVSLPDFYRVAQAFGIAAAKVRTWKDFNKAIPAMFASSEPSMVIYHMDPEQPMVPKLDPIYIDGKPTSPPFWKMSPYAH